MQKTDRLEKGSHLCKFTMLILLSKESRWTHTWSSSHLIFWKSLSFSCRRLFHKMGRGFSVKGS